MNCVILEKFQQLLEHILAAGNITNTPTLHIVSAPAKLWLRCVIPTRGLALSETSAEKTVMLSAFHSHIYNCVRMTIGMSVSGRHPSQTRRLTELSRDLMSLHSEVRVYRCTLQWSTVQWPMTNDQWLIQNDEEFCRGIDVLIILRCAVRDDGVQCTLWCTWRSSVVSMCKLVSLTQSILRLLCEGQREWSGLVFISHILDQYKLGRWEWWCRKCLQASIFTPLMDPWVNVS